MPYIEIKTTVTLSEDQKVALKSGLGKAITLIPGKTEAVTMVGLIGGVDLYFGGEALTHGAYVEVKMYKATTRKAKVSINKAISDLLRTSIGVSPDNVYLTFFEQEEWGRRGELI
ncbi:MAG: phenylpyruvate tautomerase MIF-related protein [Vallitaleaceae bacterium]|jgi:phenylpyruvate tautomerase PptA (4-oxalocrotonate tautomerase family)|nr:phenylpyruvate tautomerase MIF-related protein [Vallitaleaceae bacterium]